MHRLHFKALCDHGAKALSKPRHSIIILPSKVLYCCLILSQHLFIHYIYTLHYIYTFQILVSVTFFYVFGGKHVLCSSRLHLFDQKYSKNTNIVKYYCNFYLNIFFNVYFFVM